MEEMLYCQDCGYEDAGVMKCALCGGVMAPLGEFKDYVEHDDNDLEHPDLADDEAGPAADGFHDEPEADESDGDDDL